MKQIDMPNCKNFCVGNLFDIHPTKAYKITNKDLLVENGVNPVVVNSAYNNGIGGYTNLDTTENGNIITFSDTTTADAIFYQESCFVGYPHIQGLYPKCYDDKWNKYSLLFFLTVFKKTAFAQNFDYANKFTRDLAKNIMVSLPKDSYGNPDFVYMEDYMKRILDKTKKRLNKQLEINQEKKILSSNGWCDFQVGNLFKKVELRIKKGSFDKKFDVSEVKTEEFNLPLVNAKHFNNGIMYYGRKSDFEYENMTLDVVQNGAIATGDVYVQPQDTGVLWDAYLLKPLFDTNEHVLRFIATSLRKTLKEKYGYDDKCTWEKVKMEFIKLPAVSADTPNFAYMENYMRNIMAKQRANLDVLQTL